MRGSVAVVAYSKYSDASQRFLTLVGDALDLRRLCIDHEDVRRRVLQDDQPYPVRVLPTVFVFFSDGEVEAHAGAEAFRWAQSTLQAMRRITEETVRQMTPAAAIPAPATAGNAPARTALHLTPIGDADMPARSPPPSSIPSIGVRTLDTEPLFPLPAQADASRTPPDPSPIPDGDANLQRADDPDASASTDRRGIKQPAQDSVLSLAQKLQKQRDEMDGASRPPGAPQPPPKTHDPAAPVATAK